jgi:hypothetical protein
MRRKPISRKAVSEQSSSQSTWRRIASLRASISDLKMLILLRNSFILLSMTASKRVTLTMNEKRTYLQARSLTGVNKEREDELRPTARPDHRAHDHQPSHNPPEPRCRGLPGEAFPGSNRRSPPRAALFRRSVKCPRQSDRSPEGPGQRNVKRRRQKFVSRRVRSSRHCFKLSTPLFASPRWIANSPLTLVPAGKAPSNETECER